MYAVTGSSNPTGYVSLSDVECITSTQPAQYEIISGRECIHKRGLLGVDETCEITIKNIEEVPADFKAIFSCNNVDSNSPKIVETETKPISSGKQETFSYKYKTNNDFKCVLSKIESSDTPKSKPQVKIN